MNTIVDSEDVALTDFPLRETFQGMDNAALEEDADYGSQGDSPLRFNTSARRLIPDSDDEADRDTIAGLVSF